MKRRTFIAALGGAAAWPTVASAQQPKAMRRIGVLTQARGRIWRRRSRRTSSSAIGGTATGHLLQATRTVPIVFAIVPDPVGSGFVASLSRPGGNATGFLQFEYSLAGKWLELLKEIGPGLTRVAVLRDSTVPAGIGQLAVIQSSATSLGVDVSPIDVRNAAEIERDVTAFARSSNGGLIVASSTG